MKSLRSYRCQGWPGPHGAPRRRLLYFGTLAMEQKAPRLLIDLRPLAIKSVSYSQKVYHTSTDSAINLGSLENSSWQFSLKMFVDLVGTSVIVLIWERGSNISKKFFKGLMGGSVPTFGCGSNISKIIAFHGRKYGIGYFAIPKTVNIWVFRRLENGFGIYPQTSPDFSAALGELELSALFKKIWIVGWNGGPTCKDFCCFRELRDCHTLG